MRLLKFVPSLLLLALPGAAAEYHRIQGPLTIDVFEWTTDVHLPNGAILPGRVPAAAKMTGLWITACAQENASAMPRKVILDYRSGGKSLTAVAAFGELTHSCGNVIINNVELNDVIKLSIVTSEIEFVDVSK